GDAIDRVPRLLVFFDVRELDDMKSGKTNSGAVNSGRREFFKKGAQLAAGLAVTGGLPELLGGSTQDPAPAQNTAPAVTREFPKGFLWGAATAAHQVEGNNVNSDLWLVEHLGQTMFREASGDACD